ncbi:MAG: hypothetical protein NTZ07_04575 [Candidatus Woesebacteria bacterium]|nr:hypothetical protein [Candidatus Woesebacteria bacterium]
MRHFFSKNYSLLLKVFVAISFFLAILSGFQISKGGFANFTPMLYWFGLPYGAFVWGDLFVFSILWIIILIILIKLKNPRYFWVAFFSFWLIRSLGEANYWFLQQFHPQTIPWGEYFNRFWIFKNLTDPEFWVFYQVIQQSVGVISLSGLIYQLVKLIKKED